MHSRYSSIIISFILPNLNTVVLLISAPDEQAPPTASVRSSTYIELTWLLPEAPNGVIIGYQLYRNSSNIADLTERMYNDTGLTPNSYYSYSIESYNIIGSTTSTQVVFKTLEGIPTGLSPPTYQVLNSTAVNVLWTEPMVSHGTISNYVLLLVQTDAENEEVFQGNSFFYVVTNLRPFTTYSFIVQACTTGGCGSSSSSQVQTAQAPPTSQPAPTVTALSDTELQLQWDAPPEPNGIIVRYDFFQREDPFEGDGVFVSSVDGRDTLSLVVARLEPFTRYQFRVESHTEAGGTSSEWSEGMTLEAGMMTQVTEGGRILPLVTVGACASPILVVYIMLSPVSFRLKAHTMTLLFYSS